MASSNKEINKIIRRLEAQGWRIKEGKHIMAFPPDSRVIVTISKSPKAGATNKIVKQCRDAGATL